MRRNAGDQGKHEVIRALRGTHSAGKIRWADKVCAKKFRRCLAMEPNF